MSNDPPSAVSTSSDRLSQRPTKKRALTPNSAQAASLDALFAKPDQQIRLPPSSSDLAAPSRRHLPPEIVANVQGSSAGAGSGEFHVYKASRRREYERLKEMDEQNRREKEGKEFEREKEERERRDEEKTKRNREKRLKKMKGRKGKGGGKEGEKPKNGGVKPHGIMRREVRRDDEEEDIDQKSGVQEPGAKASLEKTDSSAGPAGLIIHDED